MDSFNRATDSQVVRELTSQDVDVWFASLEQPAAVVTELEVLLTDDEKNRAGRFYFEQHRRFYVAGRGILRVLLSHYTGIEPGEIQFEYTKYGKPFLASRDGFSNICFNLSHSYRYVMYAFTRSHLVGIDIEYIRPIEDMDQIALRNFSADEYQKFRSIDEVDKVQAFFNCWTRKEAFIKAIGEGVSFPLQKFDVSLEPGYPAQLISLFGSPQNAKHWSMHDLRAPDGYAAALVVQGKEHLISQQNWNDPS